jgi:hypothetical protein
MIWVKPEPHPVEPNRRDAAAGEQFSAVLARFAAEGSGERLDLAAVNRFLGRRSLAAMLLFLALPMALPIPAPGVSVVFGLPLILVSAQLLCGRRTAWLPARLARRSIARSDFADLVARLLPLLRRLEHVMRPRLPWLVAGWVLPPVGAICLVLAVVITLPIPLGHMVPGTAISVLALGIIERDGLAIGFGMAIAVLGLVIVALASAGVIAGLRTWFGI